MIDHPPDMRRPGPTCQSGNQANIRNTHNKYTAVRLLADSLGAAILGAALAWFSLEWADRSYHLGELAGRCYMAEVSR